MVNQNTGKVHGDPCLRDLKLPENGLFKYLCQTIILSAKCEKEWELSKLGGGGGGGGVLFD